MKATILTASLVTALMTVSTGHAAPAAGGGSAGGAAAASGTAAAATSGGQIVAPATGAAATPTTPGAQPGRVTVVPGPTLPPRTIPYPPSTIISGTNAPLQNPAAMNSRLASSNQFGTASSANQLKGRLAIQDQTVTASDRVLLQTLQRGVGSQLGIASGAQSPVHFFIDNGTVTVVGTVANAAERAGILASVQQTPGVLQVYNDLHVAALPGAAQPGANFFGAGTDHAFSAADRTLLTTVQQEAAAQLGINSYSGTQMPVHFSIQNGVVGVTGRVNSPQEKAALLADLQRTPGVNRVVDNIIVTGGVAPSATAPTAQNPGGNGAALSPTSRENETNHMLLNTTNSSGY